MKKKLDIGIILGTIYIIICTVIISPFLILIAIIERIVKLFKKGPAKPAKSYDIYITYAPGDFLFAQKFIQASMKRGLRCFISEFRESDVFADAINGSKEKEKQLKQDILKIYAASSSFVLISSGQLKSIPSTFSGAKAIYMVTTNSDRLNLFEMSLWRYDNDRINIILCRETETCLDFERHKFDPTYLTIGYDYSDGEIGESIDCVVNDLNNPSPESVEDARFLMASHKILELGKYTPVNVYAFSKAFEEEVRKTIAEELGRKVKTNKSGHFTLNTSSLLKIVLECPDAEIEDAFQEFRWEGTLCKATFQVLVPHDSKNEQIVLTGRVYANNVPICILSAVLDVKKTNPKPHVKADRVEKAFASYSSKDRDTVLSVVEGMLVTAPWMDIFLDVISLRSGKDWEPQLYKKIDWSDIFYLFWSNHAKESLYVEKEWHYALNSKGIEFIEPIPLEKPEIAPPPEELKQKHFNSWTLFFKSGNSIS